MQDLGWTDAPCVVVQLDKTQEKALNLALNKITGQWDERMLAELLQDIQSSDIDTAVTGFEPPEIEQLFQKVFPQTAQEDHYNPDAELQQPCCSRPGDLWHLGVHQVFCGDATTQAPYAALLPDTSADLILTDPPYNVNVTETAGSIQNDNMPDSEFSAFLLAAFQEMFQRLAKNGSIYVFHSDTKGLYFRQAFEEAGFYLSGCCIWVKDRLVLGRSPYQWQHEPCLYGWRKDGTHQWYSDRKQTTIWEYDRPSSSKEHPTMKPIGLLSKPIQNSTKRGDVVLDPFLGSGSTLMACAETGRICRGIELDPKFMDVIVQRFHTKYPETACTVERNGTMLSLAEALQQAGR